MMYAMAVFPPKVLILCLMSVLCYTDFVEGISEDRGNFILNSASFSTSEDAKTSSFDLDFLRNCIRKKETVVLCTRRHLRHVPRGLPASTTHLNLTGNLFKTLGPNTFPRLHNLKHLDMSRNRITTIEGGSFKNTYNLTSLYLNHNNISVIQFGAFDDLVSLEVLGLAYTRLSNLNSVDFLTPNLKSLYFISFAGNRVSQCKLGKEFRNLENLTSLDLANNVISDLEHDCFAPLNESHVEKLDLSFNNIRVISHPAFWPFRNLSYVFLGGNKFDLKQLNTTFDNLNSIDTVSLHLSFYNSTFLAGVKIPLNTTFHRLAALPITHLDLSYVGLRGLPETGLFSFLPQLETLLLVGNNITQLPPKAFGGLGSLKTLDMRKNNYFPNVKKGSFVSLENLTSLSLTLAKGRSDIHGSVFSNLPKLRSLTISGPRDLFAIGRFTLYSLRGLSYLENLTIEWHDLPGVPSPALKLVNGTLQKLSFLHGHISALVPRAFRGFTQLDTLDIRYNKLPSLPEYAFDGLVNLTNLKLSHNFIKSIDKTAFLGLLKLEILYLESNHLCFKASSYFPPPFTGLSALISLHLENQDSRCYFGGIESFPPDFFAGLFSLKRLHLSRNKLGNMLAREETSRPFANLTTLEVLDLSYNNFDTMTSLPFENLTNLTSLYLSVNRIPSIPDDLFKAVPNLRKLMLNSNRRLGKLPKEGLSFLNNLERLNLEDIPLQCTCEEEWFYDWVVSNQTKTLFYNLSNYGCVSPERLVHKTILDFDAEAQGCHDKTGLHLAIFGSLALVIFLVSAGIGYRNRWYIKYGCLVAKARFHGYQTIPEKKFDAFVSYNHNDRAWVMDELVPHLEDREEFRLCLDYRDFVPGAPITDNIVNAIYDSRKTVCLVTEEFLKSEWCEMEVQMATYRLFDEQVDVLILVFLEDIPDRALHRYHRLRRLMCKRTYLEWPKDPQGKALFWERLKEALKTGDRPPIENII
ncbi:PREDICTED: toll-like receptor 13 [Branchiostoma belcheri]|uniref:Toll-like receptor 13 n=1 Tax=Branchiostoma belcheri TaxID=7741 RepID=A0A6P4ZWK4_BRABE|nr:PREDICTED: toll-like receptor 13 [Branchiostoma belcheri]